MFAEYCALIGASQWLSHPLRPCEMGANERVHQEVQKMLGIVVKDVARGHTDHWGDLLAVVEYCIDTTPGPHGYTPRDLDRAWSLGVPLEKDLLKSTLEFEPVSDWARKIFGQYKAVSKVVKDHLTSASEARVRLANRYRREVDLKVGDRVVWRAPGLSDPDTKGRVPWKKGLTGPWEVVSCKGNRLQLAGPDGAQPLAAHAEDCVLIPDDVCADARDEIQFDSDPDDSRPSLGQMIKGETKQVEFTMKRRGKQYVLKIGDVMAFRKGYGPKLCAIGRVTSVAVSEGVVHVHKYAPEIGGLRVKWCLLYLDQQGQESLAPEGGRPCIEEVKMSLLITKVELSRDGILQASSARKLDKGGYRLEERTLSPWTTWSGSSRAEEQKVAWECSPLGLRMASRENRKLSLNTFGMKVCPSTELTSWRFSPDTVGSLRPLGAVVGWLENPLTGCIEATVGIGICERTRTGRSLLG